MKQLPTFLRMGLFALLFFGAHASSAAPVLQQDQTVFRAYVDTTQTVVGGTIDLIVEKNRYNDLVFTMDTLPHFEILSARVDTNEAWIRSVYTLLAIDSGDFNLPLLQAVGSRETYSAHPGTVRVRLLPADGGVELAEARAVQTTPFVLWWWIKANYLYLLAGLLAGVALYFIVRKLARPKPKVKAPAPVVEKKRNPFKEALEGIEQMRKTRPWEDDPKAYYVALGDLVRIYLEHRTGLPLAEKTTEEGIEMVHRKWTGAQIEAYRYILTRADMVKFAKGQLDVSVHRDCLNKAEELILAFKPAPENV